MKRKPKSRGRYGSGSLWLRNRIFWVRYREAQKRPDGTTLHIQHCESTGSGDRAYAERFLRRRLLELGGRRPGVVDSAKISYQDLRENLLTHYVEQKKRSLKWTKEGKPTLNTLPLLDKFFGTYKASEITTADLRRFRREAKTPKRNEKRLNRYMATLRRMFRLALRDELITRAEMPGYFPMTPEPNVAVGARLIEPRWYAPLRRELPEPLRSAFTLAYHVAIRPEELYRLRWEHVDVKRRVVNLSADITKTGKPRYVPLPQDYDLPVGQPADLVFPLGDYRDPWRKACVKVGAGHLECTACGARCNSRLCPTHGKRPAKGGTRYVGITLRHCRHTVARRLSDNKVSRKRAKDMFGDVTDSMFDRYNIPVDGDVEQIGRTLERAHRREQRAAA
jgi:integrase